MAKGKSPRRSTPKKRVRVTKPKKTRTQRPRTPLRQSVRAPVALGSVTRQRPNFNVSRGSQGVTTNGNNVLVTFTAGSDPVQIISIPIQPGLAQFSLDASTTARVWQQYEFSKLSFTTKSAVPTSAPGLIGVALMTNPTDANPTDLQEFSCLEGAVTTNVWNNVELIAPQRVLTGWLAVRNGPVPGQDIKTYDRARVVFAFFDVDPGSVVHLSVSYIVKFKNKQFPAFEDPVGEDEQLKVDTRALPTGFDAKDFQSATPLYSAWLGPAAYAGPRGPVPYLCPMQPVDYTTVIRGDGRSGPLVNSSYYDTDGSVFQDTSQGAASKEARVVDADIETVVTAVLNTGQLWPDYMSRDTNFAGTNDKPWHPYQIDWVSPGRGLLNDQMSTASGHADVPQLDGSGAFKSDRLSAPSTPMHGVITSTCEYKPNVATGAIDPSAVTFKGVISAVLWCAKITAMAGEIATTIMSSLGPLAVPRVAQQYRLPRTIHLGVEDASDIWDVDWALNATIISYDNHTCRVMWDNDNQRIHFAPMRAGYMHIHLHYECSSAATTFDNFAIGAGGSVPDIALDDRTTALYYTEQTGTADYKAVNDRFTFIVGDQQLCPPNVEIGDGNTVFLQNTSHNVIKLSLWVEMTPFAHKEPGQVST